MTATSVPTTLTWTYSPWRENWRRPAGLLLSVLAISALAGYSFTTPNVWPAALGWGGISLVFLLGSTMTIYLPVSYTLDEKGVSVRFIGPPSFRAWEHYRNFYAHKPGVHLTTMPSPSPLDPFRGHMLMYDNNREAVLEFIGRHIVKEAASTA